ncbi:MAG TPA: class I SAM-dependent methyltransferase [Candidatus Saccharimonadales bacterium]|jgi:SAM-dependent methyltransferase
MADQAWRDLHQKHYRDADWIDKPSLFAQDAIKYFPKSGRVLDLGAGQGQDSRFFAEHGYDVVSTDIEDSALELSRSKLPTKIKSKVTLQKLDLREELPFASESFDVVYAHLSLHYFDIEKTWRIFTEITRVLKPGGIVALFINSTSDPEYGSGEQIEPDFFQIDNVTKRYFNVKSTRKFISDFYEINLLDNFGETYKDAAKGVHNLIRFIGTKPDGLSDKYDVPCVGAIIERTINGEKEVYLQTRWKPGGDPKYSGTLEFPIGRLDTLYENVFETLAHEIKSESGLTLMTIRNDSRTKQISPQGDDAAFGFHPFCCVQQLKNGKPWIGFIFICEVESGVEPKAQLSEAKDAHWAKASEVEKMIKASPEKFFTLELPAWQYYFNQTS